MDSWLAVERELEQRGAAAPAEQKSGGGASGGQGLVVVSFAHAWNPGALFSALAVEQLRSGPDISFARVFIVDPDVDRVAMHQHGATEGNQPLDVVATPAFAFFWKGKVMTVRRPDWDDDVKFVGALDTEKILDMIRHARETAYNNEMLIHVDF